ncbi:uncharacterized protein LOC114516282 [Dendronephthya gigantea]|uniref:uncharacterized protein LOC114516282 n=1 Tax=Dendronephthya gigantea TaxID=151771 RepID=UPI001068EAAC|nr:uncharacterized protein LOC114516282 [Dendronephthya gigantea]
MYGRGRGSYLGLLLETQIGKTAVASVESSNNVQNDVTEIALLKSNESASSTISSHSQDVEKKSPQPTWTSLDLLGNRGKRDRCGGASSPKPSEESIQVIEDDHTSLLKKDGENNLARENQSTHLGLEAVPDQKPKLQLDPKKEVHLVSPQELLSSHTNSSVKDETPGQSTSPNSRYIPPHLRKGFSGKPDIYSDPVVTKYKKFDAPTYTTTEWLTESRSPQKMVESELNWKKWKLQRSFKKLITSLSVENVVGLSEDVRKLCEASQLSTKFPGVSEVNVLVDLIVARVIDEKDSFQVAVQLCLLLNVMYKDEFSANLKDVLKQHRQETFSGATSKNSRCDSFCTFLGKLCDVAKDETKSFQDCLRHTVRGCLHDWVSPFQTAEEYSQESEVKVFYLCRVLEVTKNVLTAEKRLWIKSCFGKIKNCILSDKMPRVIKETLVDQIFKCLLSPSKENETSKAAVETPPSAKTLPDSPLPDDPYRIVKKMLTDLELSHLFEKFQDNLIRDTLLCVEKNELKNTLQEASFAPGAILEIQLYLEKNGDSINGNVPEKSPEVKPSRDIVVDPRTRLQNVESNLREILLSIESEKQKDDEEARDSEEKQEVEAAIDESNTENVESMDFKELQKKLLDYQNSLDQDAGGSCPENEDRIVDSSRDIQTSANEILQVNHLSNEISTREVSLVGERRSNIAEFKDENTQAGNPVVNWTQQSEGKRYGGNERSFQKYKGGRGRGRRNNTGLLENTNDDREYHGYSGDKRGSRWNSRDMKGYQYG